MSRPRRGVGELRAGVRSFAAALEPGEALTTARRLLGADVRIVPSERR